jgi:phenylalanyl-tRNA synthetase beta chain
LFEKGKPVDLYDVKSDLMALLAPFDLGPLTVDDRDVPGYYLEGRAARVSNHQGTVAYIGEIDPTILAEHKIKQSLLTAEIFLGMVYPAGLKRPQHRELPKLPAVHRDFSLFVPEGVPFAEVRGAVGAKESLTGIEAREVFRGKPAPEGFYGLLLRATWQPLSASFTDEQINKYAASIVGDLEKKLGVQQRTG